MAAARVDLELKLKLTTFAFEFAFTFALTPILLRRMPLKAQESLLDRDHHHT